VIGPRRADGPMEVSVRDVSATLAEAPEDLMLLDCRRQNEWDLVRLARGELRPMEQIGEWLGEIAARVEAGEGSAGVVVYCHTGRRSLLVARALRDAGVDGAASMAGGIEAWSLEIDPAVRRYTKRDLA
jgi:rhodanese-related sulfurtransferase